MSGVRLPVTNTVFTAIAAWLTKTREALRLMLLAVGRASAFALAGVISLASGVLVMQRARRMARSSTALTDGAASRAYVWKVDVPASPRSAPLPSRFNRGPTSARPLADELKDVQLPPGPEAVGLQHRRRTAEPAPEPAGAPAPADEAAAADDAPVAEGVQEPLPLFGPASPDLESGVPGVSGVPVEATGPVEANVPIEASAQVEPPRPSPVRWTSTERADDARPGSDLPPLTVSWQTPEAPPAPEPVPEPVPEPEPEPEPTPVTSDGVPDHATLVRQYIRALRRRMD